MGKTLTLVNTGDFTVTGILKDIPQHSHVRPEFIASLSSFETIRPRILNDIKVSGTYFYIMLRDGASPIAVEAKLKNFFEVHYGKDPLNTMGLVLQPLDEVYLYSAGIDWDIATHGNIAYVRSFALIAFLSLVMASFNYANLLTVLVKAREKELAVRKLLGAESINTLSQFLVESIAYFAISMMAAVVIVEFFMPGFNQLTGKQFTFNSLFRQEIVLSILAWSFLPSSHRPCIPRSLPSGMMPLRV